MDTTLFSCEELQPNPAGLCSVCGSMLRQFSLSVRPCCTLLWKQFFACMWKHISVIQKVLWHRANWITRNGNLMAIPAYVSSWKAEKLANELKPRLDSNEGTIANKLHVKMIPGHAVCTHNESQDLCIYIIIIRQHCKSCGIIMMVIKWFEFLVEKGKVVLYSIV